MIRRAGPDDADRLSHVGVATFIETYTFDIAGDAMVAHCSRQHSPAVYADYLASSDCAAWIAEYAPTGAPVGYALTCPPDLPVPKVPGDVELRRIYVLSRFHRRGLGERLLAAAIDEARAGGAPRLLLGTYQDNHLAVAFYRKHGFEVAGTRQFRVGDRLYDDIVMAKRI